MNKYVNNRKRSLPFRHILIFCPLAVLAFSCKDKISEGFIIATEIRNNAGINSTEALKDSLSSRIIAVDPDHPDKRVNMLTADFYSARSPEISYDGKKMLFCALRKKDDLWQIWEMELASQESSQVTACEENCTDPAYLPGNKCIFSKRPENHTRNAELALFVCNLDGSEIKQITFHPHADRASAVLRDGRIVTISLQLYPEPADKILMVMRPDGTKAQLYYACPKGNTIISRPWETTEGMIFFTEYDILNAKGNVIAINQNRPLQTRHNLSESIPGSFRYICPKKNGLCLVSYRKSDSANYSLYLFDPEKRSVREQLFSEHGYQITEAVEVMKKERPRDLPSEVDESFDTGLILCQDINAPDINDTCGTVQKKSGAIKLSGINESFGEVEVEKDGSFQLRMIADTPFRIQTLDNEGNITSEPTPWLWIRPNERRGFVGLHSDIEMAPENKIPLAVKKPPVLVHRDTSFVSYKKHIVE